MKTAKEMNLVCNTLFYRIRQGSSKGGGEYLGERSREHHSSFLQAYDMTHLDNVPLVLFQKGTIETLNV